MPRSPEWILDEEYFLVDIWFPQLTLGKGFYGRKVMEQNINARLQGRIFSAVRAKWAAIKSGVLKPLIDTPNCTKEMLIEHLKAENGKKKKIYLKTEDGGQKMTRTTGMNEDLQVFVDIDEFVELPQCIRDIDSYINIASSSNANDPENVKT